MKQRKRYWVKSGWTISLVSAVFSFLLTVGYDFLKGKPILTTIWIVLQWLWDLILKVLTFNIKVWWLIIGGVLFTLLIKLINGGVFKPDFYNYREDTFKDWRWTWEWVWSKRKNAWVVSDLRAYCPKCNTPMLKSFSFSGFDFDCPRCDFKAIRQWCEQPDKIQMLIHDNIDRKDF